MAKLSIPLQQVFKDVLCIQGNLVVSLRGKIHDKLIKEELLLLIQHGLYTQFVEVGNTANTIFVRTGLPRECKELLKR